ncbi:MAG: ABC transporter permease [Alphaproteobacteria bacterium]|nr:ABC transporter permease [Alphaproteobacteria bacterium]
MNRYLLRRLAQSAIAVLGTVTLVFFIQRLAGDPTLLMLPEGATREDIETLRRQLGFDRPVIEQYLDYVWQLLRLDLGQSLVQRLAVGDIIASRLPYTLYLAAAALVVALGIGLPVGVLMAVKRDTRLERLLVAFVLIGQSMPTFWSGILLILFFAVTLGVMPASGVDGFHSVILPAIALGALTMATFARVTRTAVLEELSRDYVPAAQAKGLRFRAVVFSHILRNAATPIITVSALEIANLLAGAIIVETVFAWPGLGQLAVQSIAARDFPIVQGIVLLGSFVAISLNLLADILYSVVDPRIRLEGRA